MENHTWTGKYEALASSLSYEVKALRSDIHSDETLAKAYISVI